MNVNVSCELKQELSMLHTFYVQLTSGDDTTTIGYIRWRFDMLGVWPSVDSYVQGDAPLYSCRAERADNEPLIKAAEVCLTQYLS